MVLILLNNFNVMANGLLEVQGKSCVHYSLTYILIGMYSSVFNSTPISLCMLQRFLFMAFLFVTLVAYSNKLNKYVTIHTSVQSGYQCVIIHISLLKSFIIL